MILLFHVGGLVRTNVFAFSFSDGCDGHRSDYNSLVGNNLNNALIVCRLSATSQPNFVVRYTVLHVLCMACEWRSAFFPRQRSYCEMGDDEEEGRQEEWKRMVRTRFFWIPNCYNSSFLAVVTSLCLNLSRLCVNIRQQRVFFLHGSFLYYFEGKKAKKRKGVVPMELYDVIEKIGSVSHYFCANDFLFFVIFCIDQIEGVKVDGERNCFKLSSTKDPSVFFYFPSFPSHSISLENIYWVLRLQRMLTSG